MYLTQIDAVDGEIKEPRVGSTKDAIDTIDIKSMKRTAFGTKAFV